jgi:glycine/D-amino acid oxidase-like deaminating enzyme
MDVIVVGAGVFGTWTAHHLRAAGAAVTLLDAYGAANDRASSGDYSRILRCGYGPDEIYSRMAWRSLAQWRALDERPGDRVWHPCGVLWLAAPDDPYVAATRQTLTAVGRPIEILDTAQVRARFPHLSADDLPSALYEPDGGALAARRAVRKLVEEFVAGGGRYIEGRVQPPDSSRISAVRLDDGKTVVGDRFVFACGAWLPKVFPDVVGGRIRPTRQTVVYFATDSRGESFGPAHTPAWVDFPAGIYGVPDIDGHGLKVGIDEHGPAIDPDSGDRVADDGAVRRARAWLERRFPAMRDARMIEARICQYENTSTGDFLIDRHPACDNVWLVGGGSGHGFKHGPAVGEDTARMVLDGQPVSPRFALATKSTEARRAVY